MIIFKEFFFKKFILLFAICLFAAAVPHSAFAQTETKIVILSDGLLGGKGLSPHEKKFSKQLALHLENDFYDGKTVIVDFSHEEYNTAFAYQYMPEVIAENPDIVIIALGYNDALSGENAETVYNNLDNILSELSRENFYVLLLLPSLPHHLEHKNITNFNNMFSRILKRHNIPYTELLMKGVIHNSLLMDPEVHYPTEKGIAVMVNNVLEQIQKMITLTVNQKNDLD